LLLLLGLLLLLLLLLHMFVSHGVCIRSGINW